MLSVSRECLGLQASRFKKFSYSSFPCVNLRLSSSNYRLPLKDCHDQDRDFRRSSPCEHTRSHKSIREVIFQFLSASCELTWSHKLIQELIFQLLSTSCEITRSHKPIRDTVFQLLSASCELTWSHKPIQVFQLLSASCEITRSHKLIQEAVFQLLSASCEITRSHKLICESVRQHRIVTYEIWSRLPILIFAQQLHSPFELHIMIMQADSDGCHPASACAFGTMMITPADSDFCPTSTRTFGTLVITSADSGGCHPASACLWNSGDHTSWFRWLSSSFYTCLWNSGDHTSWFRWLSSSFYTCLWNSGDHTSWFRRVLSSFCTRLWNSGDHASWFRRVLSSFCTRLWNSGDHASWFSRLSSTCWPGAAACSSVSAEEEPWADASLSEEFWIVFFLAWSVVEGLKMKSVMLAMSSTTQADRALRYRLRGEALNLGQDRDVCR